MAAKVSGGKKGRYDLGQNSDINVTPFVDIMLVLLIVMMVAVPVATLAIKVDLPPIPPQSKEPEKKPSFVSIQQSGQITWYNEGRPQTTSLGRLAGDLSASLGPKAQDQAILIRADRAVRYGDFMSVVNQLQTEGFYKVALIVEDAGPTAA